MADDLFDAELPLFPLRTVLFPGGLLALKVFEARYLDLITMCLRTGRPFGVVGLRAGTEARRSLNDEAVRLESVGTTAELIDTDSEQAGILKVRCRGGRRFRIGSSQQQADGLWLAEVEGMPDDEPIPPAPAMAGTVRALATTIATLKAKDEAPFLSPYHFDDAAWVANRWCEILPISQAAKQKLMELPDATVRLQLVDDFLRSKGVLG